MIANLDRVAQASGTGFAHNIFHLRNNFTQNAPDSYPYRKFKNKVKSALHLTSLRERVSAELLRNMARFLLW